GSGGIGVRRPPGQGVLPRRATLSRGRRRPGRHLRARTASWARMGTVADRDGGLASLPPGIAAIRARYPRYSWALRAPRVSPAGPPEEPQGVAPARYPRASDVAGRTTPWPRGSIGGEPRGSRWRLQSSRDLSART